VQREVAPGGLYNVLPVSEGFESVANSPVMKLNGKEIKYTIQNGYIVVTQDWRKGDQLEFEFPMEVKLINARAELKQDQGRIALQRGPLVYCVEGADNNGKAWNLIVPKYTKFSTIDYKVLDEYVKAITAEGPVVLVGFVGQSMLTEKRKPIFICYYCLSKQAKNEY